MTNSSRLRYPDYPTLLGAIRERPGMFLGEISIRRFHLFIQGVRFAEDYYELPIQSCIAGFDWEGFEKWVDTTHNLENLSVRSFGLAERLEASDVDGFELWFRWYDEFLGLTAPGSDFKT